MGENSSDTGSYQPTGVSAEGRHLLDYARVLYRRRRIAVAALVLIVGVVAALTYTAEPIYLARAQLLIEPESRSIVLFKDVIEQDSADKDYQETQYRILRSRSLAKKALEKLQLWDHPELTTPQQGLVPLDDLRRGLRTLRRAVANLFGRDIPGAHAPGDAGEASAVPGEAVAQGGEPDAADTAEAAPADETAAEARVIDAFLRRLIVEPVRNSRLVDVSVQSREPELAARMANALADAYIEQAVDSKLGAAKQANDWLAEQLEAQRRQVEESEMALQRYREQNDAIALDEPNNIVLQKLTNLNTAVTNAKTARLEKEALYRYAEAARQDAATAERLPAVLANSYVQSLRTELAALERQRVDQGSRLGERHPEMVKLDTLIVMVKDKLHAEVDRVVLSLKSDYEAALAHEQSLVEALDVQKREAYALNRKAIDYGALLREATSNRQIFETLLQRARETGISGELRSSNIQVVDPAAIPRSPVWPQHGRNLMIALLAGLACAVVLAFFVDYLDNRIKSPDEIRSRLGLSLLGLVPMVRNGSHPAKSPLINNGVPAQFAEAMRVVRTNVLLASGDERRTIVVTSTGPSEGKTVIACNLALALAQAGLRVVLIDADLRRPRVHTVFESPQTPGLSTVLTGGADLEQVCHATATPNLSLLPAGHTDGNPADLLGSPRFRQCLRRLSEQFDWVIVDSPPVLAVTDASLIAHLATSVLFVVGADRTSRHAAQAALDQLEGASAPFLGGVLNAVDLDRHPYYFAKYYRPEYGQYYVADRPA
jgi:capsular exopolysaccharide synthesis family protein